MPLLPVTRAQKKTDEMIRVKVHSWKSELDFQANLNTRGQMLFGQVTKNVNIHEDWYFGLQFTDAEGLNRWLEDSKKRLSALKMKELKLNFRVKFYPENIADELIETSTIEHFYLQMKHYVLKDEVYCPPDTCVLLASYACQVKHGNYDPEEHLRGFLSKEILLPDRVVKQHKMEHSIWEETIVSLWKKHCHVDKDEAMLEYLKLVENLEMYGITYFPIRNKRGTDLYLGVNALGLNVYEKKDKLNPIINFPWSEIRNLTFKNRIFTIRPTDKQGSNFVFLTTDGRINKHILLLGTGNHSLYIRRRRPESMQVRQMRERTGEEKRLKLEQKKLLMSEAAKRKEAEERERNYQNEIKKMKEEMVKLQEAYWVAQETIAKLKEQLKLLQAAKEKLERRQNELQQLMEKLEASKNMEAAERAKLEEEIAAKQRDVQRVQEEVQQKDEETKRLQMAVEEAKRKEEELKREQEAAAKAAEEARLAAIVQLPEPSLNEVNEGLKEQIKELQGILSSNRDVSKETAMDKIHRDNLALGRDKYKTLNEIRKGNTVRRVDLFENL